ncbi:MAG: 1-deoxy-D-xylulose 5-phosphate reductoisomerase [uncultured Corynebacteriales bacterium]|uniref:1-deoxy-D-xylulose 5-phosphate reductoisomerase n=1 Tax=uncultured Mycobacteriales bacterium TaxID=581187 RepID=A0A6J4HII0_9ACTN|nr:MAG: 1-deoxy-D-xylulose 5-phosphate reductoisomerase [uncultured Corynebacteriales bacterium]
MRSVVLLGSTGSIGTQALDVVRRNLDRFRIVGLAAGGRDPRALAAQVAEFRPEVVAVGRAEAVDALRDALTVDVEILTGPEGVEEIARRSCDVVLNGLDGALGLPATLAALEAGSTLALANKESLIIGGPLVKRVARPGQIVPVDSEHSALAQALRGGTAAEVRRLVVTATGGPFRGRSRDELAGVTPEQALAHPRWSMGPVISVNSATLVNKGLEVIEAHLLFDVPFDDIEVMVHPQAIIHSMVEFVDGSTIAQTGLPDMRIPIALGLAWPDRVPDAAPGLDWTAAHTWELFPLDREAFPAVELAARVGRTGGSAPAVLNAANEVCVHAFLAGRLPFLSIVDTVRQVVEEQVDTAAHSIGDVLAADAWARARARELNGLTAPA